MEQVISFKLVSDDLLLLLSLSLVVVAIAQKFTCMARTTPPIHFSLAKNNLKFTLGGLTAAAIAGRPARPMHRVIII